MRLLLPVLCSAWLLSGCIIFDKKSEAVTFHQLSAPTATPTAASLSVFIPRTLLPAANRRANVVLLDDSGWVRLEDAHRWVAPLDRAFSEALGRHLVQASGRHVTTAVPASDHLVLLLTVERFNVRGEKEAILELRHRLERADGTLITEAVGRFASPLSATTPEQFVRAQSLNLATAAQAIARGLVNQP